jgi:competence protein ComEA
MDRLVPWLRRSGWAYIVLAVVLAGLAWRIAAGSPKPTQPDTARPVTLSSRTGRESVTVHVAGAVRKPGVYRVAGDGRVIDAIRRAGGPAPKADLALVNLAAPLQDGQQVVVPRAAPAAPGGAPAAAGGTGPVSLSSATVEQLDTLDGIGPTLAARIVTWRTRNGGFASVEQLLDVPGIGQARLDALRGKVTP